MAGYGATDRRSSSDSSNSQGSSTSSYTPVGSPIPPSKIPFNLKAAFYLFGVIVLLPWNAMTLALPYLLTRLRGSAFETSFGSWLSLAYTSAGLVALIVAVSIDEKLSPTCSVTISTFVMSVGFLLLGTLPFWPASAPTVAMITLTISALLVTSTAFFRTPIIVIATAFGPEAISAYFSGTALVAVIISAGTFLATYISGTQGNNGGKVGVVTCFMVSAIVAMLSLLAYQFVRRTDLYRRKFASTKDVRSQSPEQERLLQQLRVSLVLGESVWTVSRRHSLRNLAQFYLYAVTLAVYPAITSLIVPVDHTWDPIIFKTLHFFVFNLGEFVGRLMASLPLPNTLKMASSQFVIALLRTLFIPLFLLCNVQLSPTQNSSPWIGDIGFLVVLSAFAITNAYTSSLGYLSLGSGASAQSGARVLQLWMYVGLVFGSVSSFGVSTLVQRWKGL